MTTSYILNADGNTSPILVYLVSTYTPVITFTGGTGNVAPVYDSSTIRCVRINNYMMVDIYWTADGGAEGAGTGLMNVSLPTTASASQLAGQFPAGTALNGTTHYYLNGQIEPSGTVISLYYNSATVVSNFTGANQNNTTRTMRLKFWYEI